MKKLMICILCLVSISGFAQFRMGIQGSFSALTYWQTDGYGGLPSQEFTWAKNGYQGGIFAEYDLGYSGLTIQPALMYAVTGAHVGQTLGFNDNANFTYIISDSRITVNTLRLPVNILYTYRIDPKFKVFGGFGPYIAKNLSGTEKGNYTGDSSTGNNYYPTVVRFKNTLSINGNASQATVGVSNVASIDAGMDILLGFQYKKLEISAAWMRGFSRQYHTSYVNMGNQIWNFTLGYVLFGHERKPKL
jgi:hypothetical protein